MSIKKIFACALLLSSNITYGQWVDGDIIPDFTLEDLEGNQHDLHAILDDGKMVFFELFFPACQYCWNHLVEHEIKDLYSAYGEQGSNQMRALGINVWGTGIGTQMGDLAVPNINGVDISNQNLVRGDFEYAGNYPIIPQGSAFGDTMQVQGCPTYMLACPDKRVYVSDYQWLISDAQNLCGVSLTKIQNNVRIYVPELSTCSGLNRVNIYGHLRNTGSNNITSATVKLMVNNTVLSSQDLTYSGNNTTTATMGLTEFKFDNVFIDQPLGEYDKGPYKIVVDKINGVTLPAPIEKIIKIKTPSASTASTNLNVELLTDDTSNELSWVIYNSTGAVVTQNPSLVNSTTTNTPITLANNECYTIRLKDSGGDGGGTYGDDVYLKVIAPSNTELCNLNHNTNFSYGNFGYDIFASFRVGALSTESNDLLKLSIYPNPASDKFMVETSENVTVEISDENGKLIKSLENVTNTKWVDISDLKSGVYLVNVTNGTSSQAIRIVKD